MPRPFVYTDDDLLAALNRVAALHPNAALTRALVKAHSGLSPQTFTRRIGDGTWRSVLAAAGLEARYLGQPVTTKMRTQPSRRLTDREVLAELRRLAGPDGQVTRVSVHRSPLISLPDIRGRPHQQVRLVARGCEGGRSPPIAECNPADLRFLTAVDQVCRKRTDHRDAVPHQGPPVGRGSVDRDKVGDDADDVVWPSLGPGELYEALPASSGSLVAGTSSGGHPVDNGRLAF